MGGSSKQVIGYWYKLGLHFACCYGPVDALIKIICGEREAWSGYVTDNETISIDARNLFGGKKREGGIEGDLDVMMGGPTQTANAYLSSQIAGLMPAFRGILSLVYKGGYISANNPYVKPWAFLVQRVLSGWDGGTAWYPETAKITGLGGTEVSLFEERFTEGNLDAYSQLEGTDFTPPFSVVSNQIQVGPEPGHNVIARELPVIGSVYRIRAKATLTVVNDDDAGHFGLRGEDGDTVFTFGTCRQLATDASRRPSVFFVGQPGGTGNPIGAGQLTIGQQYQFDATYDASTATFSCTLTDLSDNSVFGTLDVTVENRPASRYLAFEADDFVGAGTSLFDDIEIYVDGLLAAMNPAHIVYQALTDTQWGMGYPTAQIDDASFTEAADTFAAEGLGLCMIWNQQSSIKEFVQEVLDHAGAVYYSDPKTGKFKLKAIRADYDADYLPVYDETNIISLDNFQRPGPGETVNEITVVYREFNTGKDSSITVQDLASIQAEGGVISQTRQYPGLPTSDLAARTAERDVIASSTPLARCRITVNRSAWEEVPGGVIKLSWDKLGIESIVFRVLEINYGTLTQGQLVIELAEDVFGLPSSSYSIQEPTGFTEPDIVPSVITIQDVLEAPYWDIARTASPADLSFLTADSAFVLSAASTLNPVSLGFEMFSRIGVADYESVDLAGTFAPTALVAGSVGLIREAVSVIEYSDPIDIEDVEVGHRVLIGSGRFAEFAEITGIDTVAFEIAVNRGILDTTPQEHPMGTRLWFIEDDFATDPTERATGDDVDVKLSAFSGGGEASLSAEMSIEPDQRFYRPYPPGKIRIDGVAFPSAISSDSSGVPVTWVHRDRLQQTASYVDQEEAGIGPEAGTTYNIRAYLDSDLVDEQTGISGTSATVVFDAPSGLGSIEIESERDGVVSWQAQIREFSVTTDVETDPDFANVVALLHLNGADGSTTITDVTGRSWSAIGNAQIDTAQSVFGGASLLLDGAGDYIDASHDVALNPNADYTFECRIRPNFTNTLKCIVGKRQVSGTSTGFAIYVDVNNKLAVNAWGTGGAVTISLTGTTNVQNGVWQSVAMVRSGTTWYAFLDGNLEGSTSETNGTPTSTEPMYIGRDRSNTARDWNGHIDEVRITKGTARYTTSYTPRVEPFPDF